MPANDEPHDVLVIGGGPSGSTAALRARRRGLSVLLIERDEHPRFHIGESLLPRNYTLFRELGILKDVEALPHVPKHGASFVMGHEAEPRDFWFPRGPRGEDSCAVNIERGPFDAMLLDAAVREGVDVLPRTSVQSIDSLGDDGVTLTTTRGVFRGRVLLDASGQGTVVGRHLNTRRTLPDLCRVAYFQHFSGVHRRAGQLGGHPIIVMCEEGWFWMIPLDERRTSVGLVMDQSMAKRAGAPAREMLAWGIERCPFVREQMRRATGPDENHVCADFSYRCEPFCGPGYFLVGDAATFIDPIFSTGVCLGMMSGVKAADSAHALLRGAASPAKIRREYARSVEGPSSVLFAMVRRYYRHAFRELFLDPGAPPHLRDAVLSILAGHVFPRPVFSLRWRLRVFHAAVSRQERRPMAPIRTRHSLLAAEPHRPVLASVNEPVGAPA